mmetsp:Transcript_9927/g.20675  ORF Transcript_9927/g.20675 Transcript_9927/m.20675 type:complete len:86 (+) Transcript_9927:521-778(+)
MKLVADTLGQVCSKWSDSSRTAGWRSMMGSFIKQNGSESVVANKPCFTDIVVEIVLLSLICGADTSASPLGATLFSLLSRFKISL